MCRLDRLQVSGNDGGGSDVFDVELGMLQVGQGTQNKGTMLLDSGWTLENDDGSPCSPKQAGTDGCSFYLNDSRDGAWCHDVGTGPMRYDLLFNITSSAGEIGFVASESEVPMGEMWESMLLGLESSVVNGTEARIYTKCWKEEGTCANTGFDYDHLGEREQVGSAVFSQDEPGDEVFEEEIPDISEEDIVKVMDWIKAEVAQERIPFCWKDSYGRGVGKIPTECPPEKEKIGALCYSRCPRGTRRFGFDCHSVCPSDMRDDGLFCRKAEYGRGVGFVGLGSTRRCEAEHGRGKCEQWGLFVYPKCRPGYSNVLCCICRPSPPDCRALGLNPEIDLSCAKKILIGNPTPMICNSRLQYDAGLCYPPCNPGYDGVGPLCWSLCDSDQQNCGAGCAKSATDCALTIGDQIFSTLALAANVATLGLAAPATGAATGAAATIKIGSKTVAGTSTLGKALVSVVKLLQTVKPVGLEKGATVIQRIVKARTGATTAQVFTSFKVSKTVYKAITFYQQRYAEDFGGQTSPEIEAKIDEHFHPVTARFLKGVWADIQLEEMSEEYNWAIAGVGLAAGSVVDITGITSVVQAYAKPICKAIVPFPCLPNIDVTLECGRPIPTDLPEENTLTTVAATSQTETTEVSCEDITIDFDTRPGGESLEPGLYVSDEWADYGVLVSASDEKKVRLFNLLNPTGNDFDLGSPNRRCDPSGPGSGEGGEPDMEGKNCEPLGNVLIIQEGTQAEPDDDRHGGVIHFDFKSGVTVLGIGLLDIQSKNAIITIVTEKTVDVGSLSQTASFEESLSVDGLGNNSVQIVSINADNVSRLSVTLAGSGVITFIHLCVSVDSG